MSTATAGIPDMISKRNPPNTRAIETNTLRAVSIHVSSFGKSIPVDSSIFLLKFIVIISNTFNPVMSRKFSHVLYISSAQNIVITIRASSSVPATYVGNTIISAMCIAIVDVKYVIIFVTILDSFVLSLRCPRYGAATNPVKVSIPIHNSNPIMA